MPFLVGNSKLLDDERTFLLWIELGSLKKVQEFYKTEGIINPNTKRPFASMSLWTSAMRYVVEHPEKAREQAPGLSDADFEKWLIYKALKVFTYSRQRTIKWAKTHPWAKEHNLYEKYRNIFDTVLNIQPTEESDAFGK